MSKKFLAATAALALTLTACATAQENPNYQYSTKYKGDSPVRDASYSQPAATTTYAYAQTVSPSGTTTNHKCLTKETNRELIGGAVGGTVGAIAGKKLIGGTKGTVIGAAIGGAAGFGIGDKTIDCDPLPATRVAAPVTYGSSPTTYTEPTAPAAPIAYEQAEIAPAPTDTHYGETVGTPGYEVVHGGAPYQEPTPVPYEMAQGPAPIAGEQQVAVQTISGPIVMANTPQSIEYDYSQNMINANNPVVTPQYSETRTYVPSADQTLAGQGYTVRQGDTVYSLARQRCVGVTEIQSANGLSANFGISIGQVLTLPAARC